MAPKQTADKPQFSYECDSEESWEEARRLGLVIGEIPHLFTTAIRFLVQDAERRNGAIGPVSLYCLSRLTNSLTVNGALYFALKACCPERIAEGKRFRPEFVMHPADIASIISLLYLYRRLRAGCKREPFEALQAPIFRRVELAALIGAAIPTVGIGFAVLIAASRLIGSAIFLGIDPERYEKYWRVSKRVGQFDKAEENRRWGCHHLQVASIFYQRMGLGVAVSTNLYVGLGASAAAGPTLPDNYYTPYITELWISSFEKTRAIPTITHRGQFYPVEQARKLLMERLPFALDKAEPGRWLSLRASEVNEENAPELFIKDDPLDRAALRQAAKKAMTEEEFNELENDDSSFL